MRAPSLLAASSSLIALLPLASADLRCHAAFHSIYSNVLPARLEADCRQLAVHIPSRPSSPSNPTTGDARRFPPSTPFFPQAIFSHDMCMVQISYHRGQRTPIDNNATLGGMATYLYAQSQYRTPPVHLFESTVVGIWDVVGEAAARVVERCIANGHTGVEWGALDIPEMDDMWYMVDVRVASSGALWSRMARMDAAMAVRTRLAPGYQGVKNKFREGFYDV